MQAITEADGWVLTGEGLLLTRDGGASWTNVTPANVSASEVRAVAFADVSHGSIAFSGGTSESGTLTINVASTADGGETWETTQVATPIIDDNLSPGGPAYLSFLDEEHGWLVWTRMTSSNFSSGILYRTNDAGATWEKLSVPLGEPVAFANENEGFVVGGPTGSAAFVTHDGGESWAPLDLPAPTDYTAEFVTYGAPAFFPSGKGVLPVTFAGTPPAFGYFETQDNGWTWEFARGTDIAGNIGGPGIEAPSDAVGAGAVIVAELGGGKVRSIGAQDEEWSIVSPNGLPSGVFGIDFLDGSNGWALVASSECKSFKSDCSTSRQVFKTTDGGQTWTALSPG